MLLLSNCITKNVSFFSWQGSSEVADSRCFRIREQFLECVDVVLPEINMCVNCDDFETTDAASLYARKNGSVPFGAKQPTYLLWLS